MLGTNLQPSGSRPKGNQTTGMPAPRAVPIAPRAAPMVAPQPRVLPAAVNAVTSAAAAPAMTGPRNPQLMARAMRV